VSLCSRSSLQETVSRVDSAISPPSSHREYDARVRAIVAWGVGWCIGAVIFAMGFVLLAAFRAEAIEALLVLLASAASFGGPTYFAARRHGSRQPFVQALVWVIGIAVAGIVLSEYYLAQTALAQPGDLNINTYETMRARQASFDRWGVPPETVSSFAFTFAVVIASTFGSGLLSALVAGGWGIAGVIRGTLFGLAGVIAITAGLVLVPIGTYVLALVMSFGDGPRPFPRLPSSFALAALLAGCAAGAIIEYARAALLLNPTSGARPGA